MSNHGRLISSAWKIPLLLSILFCIISLAIHILHHFAWYPMLQFAGERTREGNDLYHEMMASGASWPRLRQAVGI